MDDNTAAIYQSALEKPEYKELVGYLGLRGVTPQGRLMRDINGMKSVDDLVYELTHVAQDQIGLQAEEQPAGELAKMNKQLSAKPSAGAAGATDFRVLLDLAIREQQGQVQKKQATKGRGML